MEKPLRNTLRLTVTQARRILEEAIAERLAAEFGIDRAGLVEDAARLVNLDGDGLRFRAAIVDHLRHIDTLTPGDRVRPKGGVAGEAVEQLVRAVAFTHLNRLCAFKLMEHADRKLLRETVGRGVNSIGFKFYLAEQADDETRWSSGQQDVAYRNFLVWQGCQLADELGALFAPDDPANHLFPKHAVLEQVLALINAPELLPVWAEDETIGWVYQYFTPKELRDQVRKESAAPRNSYELAFRNQFFTPRYVVEFLVDNTLGRMWYEMLGGATMLVERCCYLVPPPLPPAIGAVPRPRKDPRDLRLLDPAAGSGHFLLYCFDLLLLIYEEAWQRREGAPSYGPTGQPLHADYPTLAALRRAVPELILRHNLYAVDIDPRARQICALALWLRAQRAYQQYGFKPAERPTIARVNAVCAEPMPGDATLLTEFSATLTPPVLGQLVHGVFERMRLAGEAGSLLRIEADLREAIAAAKRQWRERPAYAQTHLFDDEAPQVEQMGIFDVRAISDEQFWEHAEGLVLAALQRYAERAEDGLGYRRRLFADDAAAGFAFIHLCQQGYDVVLMNPPFGTASKGWKAAFELAYPRTKNDLYAAFVERGLALLHSGGMLGAITSRTGFFLTSFQKWREAILLTTARPTVVADLGYGVLDTAMVETAAYCLEKRHV
ncbi:MAG: SAM-dependent methyltransferase [Candidatus Viridilinea halotolerans]|uniref:site-specific DNA-methyltransferase (adenine-specific) n=1 Tax=Candidatus Viridilinea halotolerans TaxID=2491704 RepID=A0A426U346_9CHLR|nr:MAG: SAM-dependent methyltransferase [Candidatus Viridilinea halotolerans]